MDERQQRRKGLIENLNQIPGGLQNARLGLSAGRFLVSQGARAAGAAITSQTLLPIIIAVVLIILFTFLIVGFGGGGGGVPGAGTTTTSPTGQPPPGGGGSTISSCTFTRAGVANSIKSSTLLVWINDAANKAGVPPSILASVAMHENPNFVMNTEDTDGAIKTNTYCIKGSYFCEKNGKRINHDECLAIDKYGACGDDPCTQEDLDSGAQNAQAVGLMQLIDVYNQGSDLCSITESLSLAANKLKNDGISMNPTLADVSNAIYRYYNQCAYGSYSYCNEVWDDYNNCKSFIAVSPGVGALQPAINLIYGLVNGITNFCGGSLNSSNFGCLNSIVPPLIENVKNELLTSVFRNNYLQCVGFVQAIITGLTGQPLDKNVDAVNFARYIPSGYNFIYKEDGAPQAGDLPIWNSLQNPYGHIAYVTKVYNDTSFEVAEGNYDRKGGIRLRDKAVDDYGLLGWLRKL